MKCPECERTGQRSTLTSDGYTTTTAAGGSRRFWDEDGHSHYHEVNSSDTGYSCSNGHRIAHSRLPKCPSCDYGKNEDGWTIRRGNGKWEPLKVEGAI